MSAGIYKISLAFLAMQLANTLLAAPPIKQSSATVYLKYIATAPAKLSSVSVSYMVQYPHPELQRFSIPLLRLQKGAPVALQIKDLQFQLQGQVLHIAPGDTVTFTIDSSGAAALTGKNKKYFNFQTYYNRDFIAQNSSPREAAKDSATDLNAYKQFCANYLKKEQAFINGFFTEPNSKALREYRLAQAQFNFVDALCNLPVRYENQKTMFPEYLGKEYIPLFNNPPKYLTYSYRIALDNYSYYLAQPNSGSLMQRVTNSINATKQNFSAPVYQYVMLLQLESFARRGLKSFVPLAERLYKELAAAGIDKSALAQAAQHLKTVRMFAKNISDYKSLPLKNATGQTITLGEVIQSGRPYLFDFWATWCKPCIEEFPYLDSVRRHFPDMNIISLSIDENEAIWRSFVNRNKAVHNSYLLIGAKSSRLYQDYGVAYIPRFIVFNAKGNCISGDFERPSTLQFYYSLEELLMRTSGMD